MAFGRANCKCCDRIIEELQNLEILNQFEGLVIQPLCDITTGDVVGYFSVVRNEEDPPGYDTQYFDINGQPIGDIPPANSQACLPLTDDFEYARICEFVDPDYVQFLRQYVTDAEGAVTTNDYELDGTTAYNVTNEANVTLCPTITPDYEFKVLCYVTDTDSGTYEQFLRKYITNELGVTSHQDFRLDGETPFVVANEVFVSDCPDIAAIEICYEEMVLADPVGGDFAFVNEQEIASTGLVGSTHVTLESQTPVSSVAAGTATINNEAPYPKSQRITVRFSKPVANLQLGVNFISNDGNEVERLRDFNIFPDTLLFGTVDISNGVTVEGTGTNSNGSIEWNDKAITEISFTLETQESNQDLANFGLSAMQFTEVLGVQKKRAKCIIDSNRILSFMDIESGLFLSEPPTTIVDCDPQVIKQLLTAYVSDCQQFSNNLPITAEAAFSENGIDPNSVAFSSANAATLIRGEIQKAILLREQEIIHGLPVTPFILNTQSSEVYSFDPIGYIAGTGTTIEVDDDFVIAWGIAQTDIVTDIDYSTLDACECRAIEILQQVHEDNSTTLLDIMDSSKFWVKGSDKPSILTDDGVLPFGVLGPFTGPCPSDPQVMELDQLCCNDDLTSLPDIANQRLAWLDGADTSLMFNGGFPIAGNDGDIVDEIRDKLDPGVAPSVVVPASVGVDVGAGGPTLRTDALNGLSVLEFDGVNDRLRLDTNNPAGDSFSFFALVAKGTDPIGVDTVLAVGTGVDGQDLNPATTNWQINSDFGIGNNFLNISLRTPLGENIDPDLIEGTWPDVPTDGIGAGGTHRNLSGNIANEEDFFDGQFHLLTVTYSNTTGLLAVYMDGDRRLLADVTPTPLLAASLQSDYFRFFGNRNGADFSEGRLAEMIYFDADLSQDEISTVNAYLVCKWGIDPSLAAGGLGDLTLAESGSYAAPTPFIRRLTAGGIVEYVNSLNGQIFPVPPLPGLAICDTGIDIVTGQATVFDSRLTTDFNIGAGALSYSIFIESGTADIQGQSRPTGYSVNQPPQSFGGRELLYPQIDVTNVTGIVHLVIVYP